MPIRKAPDPNNSTTTENEHENETIAVDSEIVNDSSNITDKKTEKIDGRLVEDFQQYLRTLPITEDKEITYAQLKATPKIAAIWQAFASEMSSKIEPDTVIYSIKIDDKGQFVANPVIKRKGGGIALVFPKGFSIAIDDETIDKLVVLDRKFIYKALKLPLPVSVIDGAAWDKSSAYSEPCDLIPLIQEDLDTIEINSETPDFTFDIMEVILEGVSKKTNEPYLMVKIIKDDKKTFSYFVPNAKEFDKNSIPITGCSYSKTKREVTIRSKKYSTISIEPFNKLKENTTYKVMRLKAEPSKFRPGQLQYTMQLEDDQGNKISAYSSAPVASNLSRAVQDVDDYNRNESDRILIFTKKLAIQGNGKMSLNAQVDTPLSLGALDMFGAVADDDKLVLPW